MGEHRFYLSPEHWASPSGIVLDGQEARHMTQALRLRAGDRVALLDGQGRAGQCRILRIGKTQVLLDLLEERFVPRPPSLPVVALAFSKAVRRGFFAEKAAELGAHAVWLWQGDFSQGKLQPRASPSTPSALREAFPRVNWRRSTPPVSPVSALEDASCVAKRRPPSALGCIGGPRNCLIIRPALSPDAP